MKRLSAAILLVPFVAGCFWAVAGGAGAAGAYAWVNGNLSHNYKQPIETAWEGTMHALNVLRLKVVNQEHDGFNGYITVKMVKGDKISVKLERWTAQETKITIRVGVLGDRDVSMTLHDQIERELR